MKIPWKNKGWCWLWVMNLVVSDGSSLSWRNLEDGWRRTRLEYVLSLVKIWPLLLIERRREKGRERVLDDVTKGPTSVVINLYKSEEGTSRASGGEFWRVLKISDDYVYCGTSRLDRSTVQMKIQMVAQKIGRIRSHA